MKPCPFCAEKIQDEAIKCRYCGEFLDGRRSGSSSSVCMPWSYEYRSKTKVLGMPLVHIAQGIDPKTGMLRVARGFIAIGNVAIGVIALGGFAFGVIALGGIALGALVFAGIALGVVSFGGMAISLYFSVGGMAISLRYAIGGLGVAPYIIDATWSDPELIQLLEQWIPGISRSLGRG